MRKQVISAALMTLATSIAFAEPSEKGASGAGGGSNDKDIVIRVAPGAGGGQMMQAGAHEMRIMKSMDGDNMTTVVHEDDREVTISESDDGIKVNIKPANGEAQEFTAKDADTLKNESPEAFELYEKYALSHDKGGPMMLLGDPNNPNMQFKMFPASGGKIEVLGIRCEFMPSPVMAAQLGKGVAVIKVKADSRGAKLGLKEFDYIKSVNGKEVSSAEELDEAVKDVEKFSIEIMRAGEKMTLSE